MGDVPQPRAKDRRSLFGERCVGRPEPVSAAPATGVTGSRRKTGVDWGELLAESRAQAPKAPPTSRAEYVYTDEHGKPLYRTVRENHADGSKKIWQERHTPKGWKPGLRDTRRVLYRLPDVIEQARAGGIVFLVEGEKVADSLEWLGLVATSSPMGAGKWTDDYAVFLMGATVVLCPDCDEPGRGHMHGAGRSLLARRVLAQGPLELDARRQDGHDLHDHLAEQKELIRHRGGDIRAELRQHVLELVASCPRADPETLYAFREEAAYHASPGDRELRHCPRCERARPHLMRAGVAYCPCGALAVPRHDTPS